jgi:LysR family hydrogen peroxide-inducible transcriptional activator
MPLFDEPFWFAEPKGRKHAAGNIMTEDDLRGQHLLLLTEGHCLRDQALAICRTADADADGDFRATSLETILQMVATGMGSTLLPAMACSEARARAVTMRRLEPGIGRRIGLVWRRSTSRLRDIHLLAKTLREHLPKGVHRI